MQTTSTVRCHHCGSKCETDLHKIEDKTFCCPGCKTIFELFAESGNSAYYEGRSLSTELEKYSFLDNYEIARKLINFSSAGVNHISLNLPAVHCSSCVYVLENLPKVHEGVIRLTLNFTEKKASIYYDPELISLRQLASLLDSIGYPPNFDTQKSATENESSRSLVIKIGVAGFCFGNIMLLSFPSYLGMESADLDMFGPFFQSIMLLLAVPVVFYGGKDYLVQAFKSIISGHIHIDVPIALGIITLFARSAFEIITQVGDGYLDSLSGLVFFLLLGRWFQQRAYSHLSFERDYTSYFPLAVLKEVNTGETISIPVGQIETDHILIIRHNEIIPADSILLSDQARIDYSFVTGENRSTELEKGAFLYAGGRQLGPSIRVKATKPCSQSYLTQLWNNPAFDNQKDNYRHLMINQVSRYFTWIVILIAVVAGVVWHTADQSRMWEIVSAVLIVACPCALALATPFTNGNSLRIFGRNHLYLRNSDTAEQLGKTDVIVFDKTGTLTSAGDGKTSYEGRSLSVHEQHLISQLAAQSTHPISRKIAVHMVEQESLLQIKSFAEIPGKGIEGEVDGHFLRIGSEKWITGSQQNRGRVLVEIDGDVAGYFHFTSHLRPGLQQALSHLGKEYPIIVLSGDNEHDRSWLAEILPQATEMQFNMSPFEKLEFIKQLQVGGKRVLMIGDGLNDAGALQQSDVGFAVTEDVSQFSPASDGIIEGSKLIDLPDFLQFSNWSHRIIVLSFILSFLYNAVGISLAVGGFLTPVIAAILMPVSSISVVAFTTISGNFLARKLQL
ncbi:heavy metal translocating P-type ATPase [Fulvivirga sedimenti]|uniref:Heavy metal translocating P-type ATPase metal-binding domain-containing protein n=1 Tax=Fulvivirga sedimenti TaxID=2879465 RepID=A0A9X1KVT9_9BACT|nr:heavy metal translocating P-type ATPase metal-binding domain-containing protein [Fulvivirga sedimenti]MCA6073249.1 heavy metal translocating P-type ATPase metal-binding domain-containing protein [Fulvivirga sedimenti]